MKKLSVKDVTMLRLQGKQPTTPINKPVPTKPDNIAKLAKQATESIKISKGIVDRTAELAEMVIGMLMDDKKTSRVPTPAPAPIAQSILKPKEWVFNITRSSLGYIKTINAKEI